MPKELQKNYREFLLPNCCSIVSFSWELQTLPNPPRLTTQALPLAIALNPTTP
ncbi:hypothetical protein [Picosynechococcus sp. NKBG042902]|uniref:hypothetical protein n=1 Tax=Picosynechococcus sp. NKBG042902 TaxID=490193 RepID=UPI000AC6D171|nr:hypothetical protein [Picosynechococcus sp. NKBG042902]